MRPGHMFTTIEQKVSRTLPGFGHPILGKTFLTVLARPTSSTSTISQCFRTLIQVQRRGGVCAIDLESPGMRLQRTRGMISGSARRRRLLLQYRRIKVVARFGNEAWWRRAREIPCLPFSLISSVGSSEKVAEVRKTFAESAEDIPLSLTSLKLESVQNARLLNGDGHPAASRTDGVVVRGCPESARA